jgi:uncharacterized protein (TIGR02246 family)
MNASDDREIRAVMAETTDLWIRHEMDAWGAHFTDDADFIAHGGVWWTSRDDNVDGHKDIPESIISQKKNYIQEVATIQAVTPDVALVHTQWSWPDYLPAAAAGTENRSGVISYVLVKQRGRWLIRAAHNTKRS